MQLAKEAKKPTQTMIKMLTPIKRYLNLEYGDRLDSLILFGSQARGEANFNSDVDLLIVLKNVISVGHEMKRTSLFMAHFCLTYNLVISRTFISKSRFEHEQSPFLKNIRREGIVL